MPKRPLQEFLNVDEPAWPLIQSWLREATNAVEGLTPSAPARSEALVATQVTTRSPMGAVIYETCGLLVVHGWLRLLGSGHSHLPRSLPEWNLRPSWTDPESVPALPAYAAKTQNCTLLPNRDRNNSRVASVTLFW
jgi:hypothetical protein